MDNFNYVAASTDLRGGFGWNLVFKWESLGGVAKEHRRQYPTNPIRLIILLRCKIKTEK